MMMKKSLRTLEIDPLFRDLIPPLSKDEFRRLESNIMTEGCRDPLVIWRGYIIDGHNRYEICMRQGIPFHVVEKDFDSREEVFSWICANQLGRRNISEETRKYLIGKRFEAEKILNTRKNSSGWNQYSPDTPNPEVTEHSGGPNTMRNRTAVRLGTEYHLSHGTVEKYGTYSKAIDRIQLKAPSVVPRILSGQYKISHSNVVALSKLPASEIHDFSRRLTGSGEGTFVPFCVARNHLPTSTFDASTIHTEIKSTPAYDPDSEITGLTLTIPSWKNSIERAQGKADMRVISAKAKEELHQALSDLQSTIVNMISAMKE